jgi:hypothetical protein
VLCEHKDLHTHIHTYAFLYLSIFVFTKIVIVCNLGMWAFNQHLPLLLFVFTRIHSRTISERVETEYVPGVVYQVGTGKGYHKASDLFRGALNESANGIF